MNLGKIKRRIGIAWVPKWNLIKCTILNCAEKINVGVLYVRHMKRERNWQHQSNKDTAFLSLSPSLSLCLSLSLSLLMRMAQDSPHFALAFEQWEPTYLCISSHHPSTLHDYWLALKVKADEHACTFTISFPFSINFSSFFVFVFQFLYNEFAVQWVKSVFNITPELQVC